jgi:hypothetical protein
MKPVLVILVGLVGGGTANATRPRVLTVEVPHGPGVSKKVPGRDGTGVIYAPMHRTIYMNRGGGTYTPGSDDSRANTSSIIQSTAVIPEWPYGDAKWNDLMTCVRDTFAQFNVTVTDVEPASGSYIECVNGGQSSDAGFPPDVGGVATVPPCDGLVVENAVVYNFAEVWGNDTNEQCWAAVQETAHAMGLDHEYLCADPMTYLSNCPGPKRFQNVDADCGEFAGPRPCRCTATQNSVQVLLNILGPRDPNPPTLEVSDPTDGADVPLGFKVNATAMDNTGIDRVQLHIDGSVTPFSTDNAPPYVLDTPLDLALGQHGIEIRAYDSGQNPVYVNRAVNVVPACAGDADCPEGRVCGNQACYVDLGNGCASNNECASALCIEDPNGDRVCSQACDIDACPGGFECKPPPAGGADKCFRGGGGCEALAGRSAAGHYALGVLFVALVLVFGRRRR